MGPDAEAAMRWLQDQGFEVVLEQRRLHEELMASGEHGRATFFAPGTPYWCVSLARGGEVAWPDVGIDADPDRAIVAARRWYRR